MEFLLMFLFVISILLDVKGYRDRKWAGVVVNEYFWNEEFDCRLSSIYIGIVRAI